MKRKIITILACLSLLIPAISILNLNPVEKVKAQGNPIEILHNPYLNDTDYWLPEVLHGAAVPPSEAVMNSSGAYLTVEKYTYDFNSWYQPWGMAHFYQGLRFHNGSSYNISKGLQHYIYIPADIPDNTIIVNFTVERLIDPPELSGNWGIYNWLQAPGPCTHFGVGFWYAVKVKFWDDPRVPAHLRNKETYLGWMSPEVFGAPNLFVQELFCDYRVWDINHFPSLGWQVYARQYGNESVGSIAPVAFDAFLGSTQDWDWHSNFAMNATPLNQEITFTYDLGKAVKEFLDVFEDRPYLYGGNWTEKRLLFQFGLFRAAANPQTGMIIPNAAMGTLTQQLYDIVGVTLIGAAPTMEVVSAKMKAHFTWFQIYDYRESITTDPLFEDCIDLWLWMKGKRLCDPYQENWENAVLPDNVIEWINSVNTTDYAMYTFIKDGAGGGEANGYAFNFSGGGVWSKAGVEYYFVISGPVGRTIHINVISGIQYLFMYDVTWANAGYYIDYEIGHGITVYEQGEIIFFDFPQYRHTYSNLTFYGITLNYTLPKEDWYYIKITPHIECWWTQLFCLRGFIDIGIEYPVHEVITYGLKVDSNNETIGWVEPAYRVANLDFESGSLFPWDTYGPLSGNIEISSDIKYSGSYSLHINASPTTIDDEGVAFQNIHENPFKKHYYYGTLLPYLFYYAKKITLRIRPEAMGDDSLVGLIIATYSTDPFAMPPGEVGYYFIGFKRKDGQYYVTIGRDIEPLFADYITLSLPTADYIDKSYPISLGEWYTLQIGFGFTFPYITPTVRVKVDDDINDPLTEYLIQDRPVLFEEVLGFGLYAFATEDSTVDVYFDDVSIPQVPIDFLQYNAKENVTLTATPAEGYYFSHWNVQNSLHDIDVNFTDNPLTLCMDRDYNVTAYFVDTAPPDPNTFTLQVVKTEYIGYSVNILEYYSAGYFNVKIGSTWHNQTESLVVQVANGTQVEIYAVPSSQSSIFNKFYDYATTSYYTSNPYSFTMTQDRVVKAMFQPPIAQVCFQDADTGEGLTGTLEEVESSRTFEVRKGVWTYFRGCPSNHLCIAKVEGYYEEPFLLTPNTTAPGVYSTYVIKLHQIQFSGGGGSGNIRPPMMMSKTFIYRFTVLNASSTVYRTWNGMVEVTPVSGATATLTLTVHYTTTYPIIEVYAENVAMARFNWTDIYHSLNCPYFDRVPTLTRFYGISINTTRPIILDMGLPVKPKELWKLTPGQEQPGTLLTDWQWNDGRVLLQIVPGDPTVSMLLQSALERARDIPFEFLPLIVMVAMLLVLFKFIKDRF